ncbi:MAG: dihydrofolate reductase, partial [Thermoproteota archaeon]|nr:dihydrofolate reductase [Thermoproteota archaeon]
NYTSRKNRDSRWLFNDNDYDSSKFYDSVYTVIEGRKIYKKAHELEGNPLKEKKRQISTKNISKGKGQKEFVNNVTDSQAI